MSDINEIKRRVIEITLEVTGEGEYPPPDELNAALDKPLSDWGVDSLSALELAVHLERQFGTRLEEQELAQMQTLSDIVKLVDGKSNG